MAPTLQNANPVIYAKKSMKKMAEFNHDDYDDKVEDPVTVQEIWELIRNINDPEHPLTLEELNVAQEGLISIKGRSSCYCILPNKNSVLTFHRCHDFFMT